VIATTTCCEAKKQAKPAADVMASSTDAMKLPAIKQAKAAEARPTRRHKKPRITHASAMLAEEELRGDIPEIRDPVTHHSQSLPGLSDQRD